jgi:ABC-type transport system involved in cytochrome c biogenesis ATPase subunit
MLLDELTEGIDESDARALMHEVRRHQRDGIMVVTSHQNHDHFAATMYLGVGGGRVRQL